MADFGAQVWSCLGVGMVMGALVIGILHVFPGEPFDYTPNETLEPVESEEIVLNQQNSTESTLRHRKNAMNDKDKECKEKREVQCKEIEMAARAVRIDKLQNLLGLEEEKIRTMIHQAKEAAKQPNALSTMKPNYMLLADRAVYLVLISLLCYVAYRDYGLNVLDLLAYLFPRETETLAQLSAPWKARVAAAP